MGRVSPIARELASAHETFSDVSLVRYLDRSRKSVPTRSLLLIIVEHESLEPITTTVDTGLNGRGAYV